MKRLLIVLLVGFVFGCGQVEKAYDTSNYESITNEKGTIKVLSGGQVVETYENAEIIYSDTDSQSIFVRTKEGKTVYISGDVIIELED